MIGYFIFLFVVSCIVIAINPWSVGWSSEGTFQAFSMQNRQKYESWVTLTLHSSENTCHTNNSPEVGNSLALRLQRRVDQYRSGL